MLRASIILTLSIASRSSGETSIAWAPGGSGASSSPFSPKSRKNSSGNWLISCANCGLPAETCWRIGSSICGCCWTTCRSCWNCGLLRRKSRLPSPPPAAPAPAPARAAPPLPALAAFAAAAKRSTGSSSPPAGGEDEAWPAAGAAGADCRCSWRRFSGIPCKPVSTD